LQDEKEEESDTEDEVDDDFRSDGISNLKIIAY